MSAQSTDAPKKRRTLRFPFAAQVLAGLVLGVILGAVAFQISPPDAETGDASNWLAVTLDTVGSTFVTLLRTIVPPLIVLAVISSIANLRNVTNAARLAWKTLLWFGATALVAVGIGIALGLIVRPGVNSGVDAATAAEPSGTGSWMAFIESIVPANFLGLGASVSGSDDGSFSASLDFNVLQLIVIAIVLGIAAIKVGKAAEPFIAFTDSALQIVLKALWWIIRLAPIGTVGLLGNAVYSYGWTTIGALGKFALTIYIGLALVLFVVYPVLARVNGLSPLKYFSGVWPAVQLAFVSRSSMGTMPVTQRVTEQNLGVPRYYSAFAVPFGATTKMDGCAAIYPAISAIFIAQFFPGISLGLTDYLLIVFVSVIGSAATAGTTGATVMLTLTLSTLGLPLEGVGLLLAVDPILDMGRTAVNVAGQALVPAIVAKREGILDVARYHAPRDASGFVPLDDEAHDDVEGEVGEPGVKKVPAGASGQG
ncbi:dicarboxylate/amino acid:cation symporter [Nocardiopsis sp. HUAS JQ3]|uniref:dicarboxylate/amino acid:cation symporter n=1 Tax=Nocardiopsis sp. HUAS JQ3 TaxID=3061629 RepID=UPI0023A9EB87|nr:dicarboxylate/amino acid:cation symporter [Nocardiopsis sp. HUAS JQ3]WDZ90013.1 dicarboxylate/amino acid:cation symporter [Nocardiopsis sp. HUAS JQ3]